MRETASARRQATRHVASILDSARELGIRDAQVAEQVMGLLIVSAHKGAPFSNVGSMVVTWGSICGSHFTDLFSSLPDDHDGPVLSLVAKGCLPFW